jgi:hypothetical protein
MQKRKLITLICTLVPVFAMFWPVCWLIEVSENSALVWKVVNIYPHQFYFAVDHMQDCRRVDIEVTNITPDEVIVDWNRDKSSFQIDGRWRDLEVAALMPYLGPNESKSFPVYVPERAQRLRLSMYYEQGPLWSTTDEILRDHNINLPDFLLIPAMNMNKKLPGHFKKLVVDVELPPSPAPASTVMNHEEAMTAHSVGVVQPDSKSQRNEQIPVTVLANRAESKGSSLSADWHAARTTDYHMLDVPECKDYMDQVMAAIGKRTDTLDYSKFPSAAFELRLEIYQDGTIRSIAICGDTNIPPAYVQAIKNCSPFSKWPDRMRPVVGGPYWVLYIDSGFNLSAPPG